MMDKTRQTLDARARLTLGVPLSLVPSEEDIPSPEYVAAAQVQDAKDLLARDISSAPRWSWTYLDALVGPMLPGDLVVVGSLMGNGKSTLLMSQMDAFAVARTPTLYIPLEIDAHVCRLRWAAWRLGLDAKMVMRQQWSEIGGAKAEKAINDALKEQEKNPYILFAPPKRITLPRMVKWCEWAKAECGARVVMLDHFHRMDFGTDTKNHRVTVTDAVRELKDLARRLGIVLIAAAQLNRSSDPIDAYTAPILARLKETAAIAEEADVVLMLSRKLRRDLPDQWQSMLRVGQITEPELGERNAMVVTCRKHRLDDSAMNGRVVLAVNNGRVA
jgi:replicative DNA helicase